MKWPQWLGIKDKKPARNSNTSFWENRIEDKQLAVTAAQIDEKLAAAQCVGRVPRGKPIVRRPQDSCRFCCATSAGGYANSSEHYGAIRQCSELIQDDVFESFKSGALVIVTHAAFTSYYQRDNFEIRLQL